jgi:hypothetical protein
MKIDDNFQTLDVPSFESNQIPAKNPENTVKVNNMLNKTSYFGILPVDGKPKQ